MDTHSRGNGLRRPKAARLSATAGMAALFASAAAGLAALVYQWVPLFLDHRLISAKSLSAEGSCFFPLVPETLALLEGSGPQVAAPAALAEKRRDESSRTTEEASITGLPDSGSGEEGPQEGELKDALHSGVPSSLSREAMGRPFLKGSGPFTGGGAPAGRVRSEERMAERAVEGNKQGKTGGLHGAGGPRGTAAPRWKNKHAKRRTTSGGNGGGAAGASLPSGSEGPERGGGEYSDWEQGVDAGLRARSLAMVFKTTRARRERTRGLNGRKPPTLKSFLGKALKPPEGALRAPSFNHLKNAIPARAPDGGHLQRETPLPAVVEAMRPPSEVLEFEQWQKESVRRTPHWHQGGVGTLFFHKGKDWGAPAEKGWVWWVPYYRRWWTVADGAQRLVRHQEHWWWKTRDGWFVLHGGEPWSYRHFPDWKREGFWNPGSGVKMVYSEDAMRVALIAPNGEWIVYDAASGSEVARGD